MGFLADKKILITGLLSNRSIAYGIARACQREGATLAFTYVNDELKDRVVKLAADFGSVPVLPCDVAQRRADRRAVRGAGTRMGRARRPAAFDRVRAARGAGRRFPRRRCTRAAFATAHDISSYSFAALAKGARPLMQGRHGALADADLSRRRARAPELQRHGARQGEPRSERALSRAVPRPRRHRASTRSPRGRSRRWPPRASAASPRSCASSRRPRRCGATSRSRKSATSPRSCSPISPARSPARSLSSTAGSRPSRRAWTEE